MGTELLAPTSTSRRQTSSGSCTGVGAAQSFRALSAGSFPVEDEHDSLQWKLDVFAVSVHQSSFKQATSFSPEVIEELEKENPEVLQWLRSAPGMVFQAALIAIYILANTFCTLLSSYVLKPDSQPKFKLVPSSLVVMSSIGSVLLGCLVTAGMSIASSREWPLRAISKTCIEIFRWQSILSYFCVAVCFCLAKIFKKMAFGKLDAGLIVILNQLQVPLTAAMSTLLVGKRYTVFEWLALSVILGAVCCFYHEDARHAEIAEMHAKCRYPEYCFDTPAHDICALRVDGSRIIGTAIKGAEHAITTFQVKAVATEWSGLVFSVTSCFLVCIASLLAERQMKSTSSTPFSTQKAQLEAVATPMAVAMSFIVPLWIDSGGGRAIWWTDNEIEGSGGGFFRGYTDLTCVLIGMDMFLSWMGGILVKKFSTLVKGIAKCFVLLLTVILSGTVLKPCEADPLPMTMYTLTAIVSAATLLFATMPAEQESNAMAQAQPILAPLAIEESFEMTSDTSHSSFLLKEVNEGTPGLETSRPYGVRV